MFNRFLFPAGLAIAFENQVLSFLTLSLYHILPQRSHFCQYLFAMGRNFIIAIFLVGLMGPVPAAPITPPPIEPASITFSREPRLGGWWNGFPAVRVCAETGVRKSRIEQALEVWRRLGYEFGVVIMDEGSIVCRNGGITGEITILIPTQEVFNPRHIALTQTERLVDTAEFIKARIYITKYASEKLLVLEHEIGHAIGWRHHASRYHLMHPEWPWIGHGSRGLGYSRYQEEMERIRAPGRN